MTGLVRRVTGVLREWLPAFAFFAVAFCLIVLADQLTMARYGIVPFRFVSAIVLAVIVSKAMLLTDFLPIVDIFRDKPLIYNTVWKTGLYLIAAIAVQYLEHFAHLTLTCHDPFVANERVMARVIWSRFWAIQIWLFVTFAIFVAARELSRRLGPGRLRRMFVGR